MQSRLADARRSPPGARCLALGALHVFAGPNAPEKAKVLHGATLVLREGHDPNAYRWPVCGRDVTVSWPNGQLRDVRRLLDALLSDGAGRVVIVSPVYFDSANPESWVWLE